MKEVHKRSIYATVLVALMCLVILAFDYTQGTGIFRKVSEPVNFTCYEHDMDMYMITGKDALICEVGEVCLVYIENDCMAIFEVIDEDYEEIMEVEQMTRYVCFRTQECRFYTDDDCYGAFGVETECTISYAVVDNVTYYCNGTVEDCNYAFENEGGIV